MIADLDPKTRRRDGFDVAYMAVWCLGLLLVVIAVAIVSLAIVGAGTETLTQALMAGVAAISTIAGAALGYQVGSRAPRRSTDPGGPEAAPGSGQPPAGPPSPAAAEPGAVDVRGAA